ncbi:2Fe-2S iron-sulfur cluster-binding protein [Methylobacterium nonmethylotrophicum]|uniref:2Fe-2S iron-sulfur cluster binding domain-containing protein n=1 Tax=Methylobacterium nonmethylotrophicum TaxID=1141884 RepID=A0A4Z0NUU7_9HYPH|nr:2Fe-2S iron-sulfur cluster-binding protein [Methylobacterium nonmethylotrophicum]TGE01295.1 2Fe-2S iron-sulfur cluster binding domain-containing protein [Methylobacterium nonmethylotrophicum]
MAQPLALVINGRRIAARAGQTLLEAGLAGGRVIPHDCATGQCDTCRVRIHAGTVDDAGTRIGETVLACRARLTSETVIEFDEVPDVVRRSGSVERVVALTPDIVEVTVALRKRLAYLPGQYVRVTFAGLPPRDYSPSLRADGSGELHELVFQIRRQEGGAVSPHLGQRVGAGHAVKVEGPFGQAFHRLGRGRLVIVSSGVGWAPAWAVARASRLREPERGLVVVAGGRHPQNLYMRPALDWLRERGVTTILTCSGSNPPADARPGRPTLHLPMLTADDTVLAAGAPGMVAAVQFLAAAAGATCYADPFHAAERGSASKEPPTTNFIQRLLRRMSRDHGVEADLPT